MCSSAPVDLLGSSVAGQCLAVKWHTALIGHINAICGADHMVAARANDAQGCGGCASGDHYVARYQVTISTAHVYAAGHNGSNARTLTLQGIIRWPATVIATLAP